MSSLATEPSALSASSASIETFTVQPRDRFVNVGATERQVSALLGSAIAIYGISRRSLGGIALAALGGGVLYRGISGHCPAYSSLGVNTNEDGPPDPSEYFERGIHVRHSVTINKPRGELFRYWRNLENLPRFMSHVKSVTVKDDKTSRWVANGPVGTEIAWDAEIINEEPDALIAWRSLANSDVDNSGSVRFLEAPADRGTEVHFVMDYIPPAGQLGRFVAKLFGDDPDAQVREDLRRFKQLMETGTIPTTQGQPRGTCSSIARFSKE